MVDQIVIALVLVIIGIAIIYIVSIWIYKRAPANMGFVRTGFMGTKVCLGSGAIVLPVFHEITWVSLETIKLIVGRSRDQAILTSDKIRVDITAELYAHVGRTVEDVLTASRSLGDKTFDADKVRNLLEAKIVGALRSYAATKTLNDLHENRDVLSEAIKANVAEGFKANGLNLEEVTIVTLEQTGKEHLKSDNVFDAEGLKIITEITSDSRRKVHATEKRTAVAIRQKDLETQLEMLDIEQREALAQANQDKSVSNEQALQMREKQVFILNQRMAVEEQEIENEVVLERMRTEREVAVTEEAKKRETSEIQKALALEQARKDKEIAIIAKVKEEELAEIDRQLAREQADIVRVTKVTAEEEVARIQRHEAQEEASIATRKRSLEAKLAVLEMDKEEAFAEAQQEQEVSNEKARALGQKQRYILEQRWEVQQEEIDKALSLERAQIVKEAAVIDESTKRETAEIKRARVVEIEQRDREIALIAKEQEREKADIRRFLAREQEERDREIALQEKTRELEEAEAKRLATTAEKERALHAANAVGPVSQAERDKEIDRIESEKRAESERIAEEVKAQVAQMHMVTQSEARKQAAKNEAEATLMRANATSDAQKITAEGIERESGARGRAEMEIEALRVRNTESMLKAEAAGLEAKAGALKKYDNAASSLELSKLFIEAERDVHIDQAKAMGNALEGAHIRMYGDSDGTMNTVRGLFQSGFGLGEALEGLAQSLPDGLRERFAANGIRGLFGTPYDAGSPQQTFDQLKVLVDKTLGSPEARDIPLSEAVAKLEEEAGADQAMVRAVGVLNDLVKQEGFEDIAFEKVWALLRALASKSN